MGFASLRTCLKPIPIVCYHRVSSVPLGVQSVSGPLQLQCTWILSSTSNHNTRLHNEIARKATGSHEESLLENSFGRREDVIQKPRNAQNEIVPNPEGPLPTLRAAPSTIPEIFLSSASATTRQSFHLRKGLRHSPSARRQNAISP